MPKQEYDNQGKYFWHLAKVSGWTEKRVSSLLLKHFSVTHWNALGETEKRAAINIMKGYAKKRDKEVAKRTRQWIMAIVTANGRDVEWLHEMMQAWGYGDSLRKLSLFDTNQVYDAVKAIWPGKTKTKGENHAK